MKHISTFVAAAVLAAAAWAHGGEDHGDEAHGPAPVADLAPRAIAATEELELVAHLEGTRLVLYVDRYATNEPVADAQVEVEGGGLKGVAAQVAPGVYALPAQALAAPGKHALAITVQAGDIADLLTATLELSPPAAAAEHKPWASEWAAWGGSAALLFAGLGLVAVRRRRWNRKHGGLK
jgi:hypothetical protein